LTDDTLPGTPRAIRDEMVGFVGMTALLAIVPLTGIYLFFDAGAVVSRCSPPP
jgi:branched-chain amino acid transport system permease protein